MSLSDLTPGAISAMLETQDPAQAIQDPVCQVLSVKKIAATNANAPDRWRIILSDGKYFAQAMLATQLKHLVENNELDRNCLVRVTQYAANNVQTRRILILLALDVVSPPTPGRLGDPSSWDQRGANGSAPAPAPAAGAGGSAQVKREGGAPAANGTHRPNAPAAARPAAGGTSKAGGPRGAGGMPIYPIEGLSPYQNKWTIKARVTSRSEIKHWSNQRGEGKLFSVNLLDESGEIKATGFQDAVDKFYNVLQENKVFYISKAKVNIAKKQFSSLKNEYEITFERDTEIEECNDASDVPEVKYEFVPLDQLESVEANQVCDVVAVVESVGELGEIISKASQKPVAKRELTLVDQSGRSVRMTLWGKTAETWGTPAGLNGGVGVGEGQNPVVVCKGVKVGDFGGRSLSMFSSSTMLVDPDLPEAHGMRGWYDEDGKKGGFKPFTNVGGGGGGGEAGDNANERRTIGQVKDEGLGTNPEKQDYFNIRATVVYIKQENLFYTACPSDNCNKKVTLEGDNSWRCEKCDRTYPEPQRRYILAANVQDFSGQMWLSGFNDIGEQLIGHTADELNAIKDENESEFHSILHKAANKMYVFNCRAKQDTFNDTTRIRYTITKAGNVDYSKFGRELIASIKSLM